MKESELIKNAQKGDKNAFCEFMSFIKTGFIVMPIINFRAKRRRGRRYGLHSLRLAGDKTA